MEYEDLIGVPFVDGGRDKSGMDCWGLAREMFRRQGIDIPDYHVSAVSAGSVASKMGVDVAYWQKLAQPVLGCLVLIRLSPDVWANHVGIYIGDGKFIHAYSATGVSIGRLRRWRSRIVGFYVPKKGGRP